MQTIEFHKGKQTLGKLFKSRVSDAKEIFIRRYFSFKWQHHAIISKKHHTGMCCGEYDKVLVKCNMFQPVLNFGNFNFMGKCIKPKIDVFLSCIMLHEKIQGQISIMCGLEVHYSKNE